jgi:hypothetical protein
MTHTAFSALAHFKRGLLLLCVSLSLLAAGIGQTGVENITVNATELSLNSSVLITGMNYTPSINVTVIFSLENNSSWWDSYKEQWMPLPYTNITTNSSGGWQLAWIVPNDWRVSEGKLIVEVGESIGSAPMWTTPGTNWSTTINIPTVNSIWGDNDPNGYIYTASNVAAANNGGIQKLFKHNGSQVWYNANWSCRFNGSVAAANFIDIDGNGSTAGSLVYAINGSGNNLVSIYADNCTLANVIRSANVQAYSLTVAPNNSYAIVTYASGTPPRMFDLTQGILLSPANITSFQPTANASIGNKSCIGPNSDVIYVGYANGNVTAYNVTGGTLWNRNIPMENWTLAHQFPVNGLGCDNNRVYVGTGPVVIAGVTNQGFIYALNATTGDATWVVEKKGRRL